MTILHIPIFHGIAPRVAPRRLTKAQSQIARNCELFSEELRPIRDLIEVNTPSKVGVKQSIYLLDDLWLHWITDVDVARSPLYLENEERIHYTGDYNPKSTDNTLADASPGTDYPTDFYRLGMPRPDTAPTVNHTGGTSNDLERSYIYTFVSDWGEEGPPSAAGTHVGKVDATQWDLTTLDATPQNQWTNTEISSITFSTTTVTVNLAASEHHFFETTEYAIISGTFTGTGSLPTDIIGTWQVTRVDEDTFTFELPVAPTGTVTGFAAGFIDREAPLQLTGWTKRIYRTLGGSYYFVDDTTGTTYTDTTTDENLGELIPWEELSEEHWWKAPNGDMQGLTTFPGGVLAGFFGNTLALSEQNIPSAWPEEHQYTFNYNIVSIGVVGNTIVVATEGFPSVVIGDQPASMVVSELEIFQACVSKRGTVSLFNGVMYPSPDGLVYVPAVGLPEVITQKFFKKKDWQLFSPETLISDLHDDRYYGFYTGGGVDADETGGIIFDPKEPGAAFTTLGITATATYNDLESDDLYLMNGDNIVEYDNGGDFLTYTWLSKLFTTAYPLCFRAAKVKLSIGDGTTTGEQAAAIAAAIAALEIQLAETELSATFGGSNNNYVSGAIGGFAVGEYSVGGGPYAAAVAGVGTPIDSSMNLYGYYDDGSGSIERHLVYTKNLTGNKPFRLPGGYLSDQWEIEFNGSDVRIHEVVLGTSMEELSRV